MTGRSTSGLTPELGALLIADAAGVFHRDEAPVVRRVRRRVHPYSTILHVELAWTSGTRWIYVKIPPAPAERVAIVAARIDMEFRILRELWREFADDAQLGVVQPYGCYREHLAIATVEAPGRTLRRVASRSARRYSLPAQRRALLLHVRLCGTWLRRFQAVTKCAAAPFDTDEMLDYCSTRLTRLASVDPARFGPLLATRVLARLEALTGAVSAGQNPVAGRHNDFAMHNIIAAAGGIRVLDFSMFDHGSTAFDASNFWLGLEILKADPTYSPGLLCRLQDEFLGAYGGFDPDGPLSVAARCRYSLNRLLTLLDEPTWSLGSFSGRIAGACYDWLLGFAGLRRADAHAAW